MGTAKTINLIRREYFWLTMVKDVRQYCESCVTCANIYPAPSHRRARLTLSSQPQEPWQEIAIDIKAEMKSGFLYLKAELSEQTKINACKKIMQID